MARKMDTEKKRAELERMKEKMGIKEDPLTQKTIYSSLNTKKDVISAPPMPATKVPQENFADVD